MTTTNLYFELDVDYATREISIRGEFDIATARCLATAISALQRAACGDITLRINGLTHIDAAGLDAVRDAKAAQSRQGRCVTVTGASTYLLRPANRDELHGLLRPMPRNRSRPMRTAGYADNRPNTRKG